MARYIRAFLLAALVVWTSQACAPRIRYAYHKADVTPEQRSRDEFECERLSMRVVPGAYFHAPGGQYSYGGPREVFDRNLFNRCMATRGYAVEAVPIPETSALKEAQ
jgi:hypothetical protein